jgi:hypothetical protein
LKELGYEFAEYKGYYVTKCGKVFNRYGRELKPSLNKGGYRFLSLSYQGKTKTTMLHRMLAECFIPNPNNYPQINHKDGNKLNNELSNLEWCTPSYNVQHAWDTGLATTAEKPVVCLDTGVVYKSARYAADTLNYKSPSAITACCLGKRKSAHKGWRWKYYQPNEITRLLIEIGFNKYPKDDSEEEFTCYLALASKFLREEKRICVEVDCCASGYTWELCKAYQGDWFSGGTTIYTHYCEDNYNNALLNDCGKYDSYEDALLEGIKAAVEILKEE